MSVQWQDRLALLLSVLMLAALQLWLRPLLPVDETRYLGVAWEMWSRGDFLVPHLNGEAYSHKPPLLFWLMHGLWSLFGVSGLSPRLLPVALSLLALWGSARLAGRLWPHQQTAIQPLVPWLLVGGLFWHNFFTLVQFDLLLVLAAMLAWWGMLEAVHKPLRGWPVVGLGIGLGVLGKGPVILVPVLPLLLAAPWWARQTRPAGWGRWYLGALAALLLGAAIALAWAIPAGLAGGQDYRQAIFWGQSAGRVVNSFAHQSPWWSYLWWLPLMWLPWVVWPQLWKAARQFRQWDDGTRFCVVAVVPALLLLSLVSGKQGKYLLPLFPLIALLIARWLAASDKAMALHRPVFIGLLLILGGGVLLALRQVPLGPDWLAQVQAMWGAALLVWGSLFLFLRLPLAALVRSAALGAMLCTAVVYLAVVELARPSFDLRAISQTLSEMQTSGRQLAYLGKYHGQFHFLGRLRQRIEPLADRSELDAWLRAHPQGFLLVNYKTRQPDVPGSLLIQPYRGGSLVVWPAAGLLRDTRRLDGLPGNA